MLIAIDYDGTIADTNEEKAKWIHAHLGLNVAPWHCSRSECVPLIGLDAYEQMTSHVYERESTLQAVEVAGALETLRHLCQRADLYVISARPPRRVEFAREWLDQHGVLNCVKDIQSAVGTSKGDICQAAGAQVLIDDDIRHLLGVNIEGMARVLLQNGRPERPECELSISFCRSWAETTAVIDSLADRV